MNNYEQPVNLETKQIFHRDTSVFSPYVRNPTNFFRRPPLFPVRSRMPLRQYPGIGFRFRAFPSPLYRSNYQARVLAPCFRQPPILHTAIRTPPPIIQKLPLQSASLEFFENKNVISPSPERKVSSSSLEDKSGSSLDQREQQLPLKTCPDLWVEASAPGGKRYYYNARTRERTWDKPMNVRIIELEDMNHLKYPQFQHAQNIRQEMAFMQRPQCSPFQNYYHCFSSPPRLMMFSQAQNMYNPPQVFLAHNTTSIQNNTNFNFHATTFPYAFSSPNATDNLILTSEIVNNVDSANESNRISQQSGTSSNLNSKEFTSNKSPDWSSLETQLSSCSSINVKDNLKNTDENLLSKEDKNLSNLTSENEQYQNQVLEKSIKPIRNARDEKEIDKSRPMCSTPVAGTSWHVVWTGDERVFFFDSSRKKSVWDRPAELMNRNEVDKLIQKPPFTLDMKQMKKDVRKTTSEGSDVIKKLKTENSKQTDKSSNQGDSEITKDKDENDMKENDRSKSNEIPQDERRKIFFETLADNKVSAFSTWENERHRYVSDSRYPMLSVKEKRQIIEMYSHKKSEEKVTHQKDLTNQKQIFISLLKEAGVTSNSQFCDIVNQYANDERFKAIEKIKHSEKIFNQFVSDLVQKEQIEKPMLDKRKKFEKQSHDTTSPEKEKLQNQKISSSILQFKEIQSENPSKNSQFENYKQTDASNVSRNKIGEQINCNIRNQEDNVKLNLSVKSKNCEREQNIAISNFQSLLDDFIKSSDLNWYTAKRILTGDHRWDLSECLDMEKREQLFNNHIDSLMYKSKKQFHRLLDEIPNISSKTSWLNIRRYVLKDQRCANFSTSERKCESEFKEYLKIKFVNTKTEF